MRPLRLTLEAFGPYAVRQHLDFADLKGQAFFLIHGPTGAGKTSILDGISYALYGETSGGLRETRDLRSHFAPAETPTRACFEFAMGTRTYRVERMPEQAVPKQRGAGTRKQPAHANLWELVDGAEVPLATEKPSTVDAKVAELLGFKASQFRQVVLLPQGRFQEFMLAGSTERQAILQTLFQTARYAGITEALVEEEKALKEAMRATQAETRQRLAQAGVKAVEDLPGLLQDASARVETLASEQQASGDTLARLSADLMEGDRAAERLAEREAARTELARLHGQARLMEASRTELDRARRCLAVLPVAQRLEEIQARLLEQEAEGTRLAQELEGREQALAQTEADLAEAVKHEVRREELRRVIARMTALEPKLEALETARREAREAALGRGRFGDLAEEQKQRLEAARQELSRQRLALQDTRTEAAQEPGREGLLYLVKKRRTQREDLERSLQELARAEAALEAAHEAQLAAQKAVQSARERHRTLQERRLTAHAARLARDLVNGQPCPVCGSESHPHPAQPSVDLPDEEDVRRALELQEDAETVLARAQDATASRSTTLEMARARRQDLIEALGEHANITLDDLNAFEIRHREDLERSRAATAGLPSAERRLALAEEARNRVEAKLSETNQRLSELMIQEAGAKARMQLLEEELLQELRVPGALSTRRREAETELEASEAQLATARAAQLPAQAAAQEARSALRTHKALLEATQTESWGRAEALEEALAAAHFHSRDDFNLARRSPDEIDALSRTLDLYAEEEAAARDRAARAEAQADGLSAPDLPALRLARDEAQARFAQAAKALGGAQAERAALDQLERDLTRLTKEMGLQDRRYRAVANLARVARGDEGERVSFERYVQGALLDDVLISASERLRRMSKQRYGLRRAATSQDLRRAGGLQLEITDTHTGRTRAVSSLSGGEGFQASLALALGLSDVVQRHAGGIRLDTVFIDEGFGSLDPESLDRALGVLDEVGAHRKVGVISHVDAMKKAIPCQIVVEKQPFGSSLRIVGASRAGAAQTSD